MIIEGIIVAVTCIGVTLTALLLVMGKGAP
jgi:hypothetical protein